MHENIRDIIAEKEIAVIGVSEKKFGGTIYKELKKRGYTAYAVNPNRAEFAGDRCYRTLEELPRSVTTAVMAVSGLTSRTIIAEAVAAGIARIWFQQGTDCSEAVAEAEARGIETVSRRCILMYAPPVTGIHKLHKVIAGFFGRG